MPSHLNPMQTGCCGSVGLRSNREVWQRQGGASAKEAGEVADRPQT